jgi:hypothetical protein
MQPEMDTEKYDIEVELSMFSYEESGRELPILSGYQSGHFYLDNIYWIASFFLKDQSELWPGEKGVAHIRFFYHPEALQGKLYPGKPFELREAYRPIGNGTILAILNYEQHTEEALHQEEERIARLVDPNRKQIPPDWEQPHHRLRKKKRKFGT